MSNSSLHQPLMAQVLVDGYPSKVGDKSNHETNLLCSNDVKLESRKLIISSNVGLSNIYNKKITKMTSMWSSYGNNMAYRN